jgi:hypothetical protein
MTKTSLRKKVLLLFSTFVIISLIYLSFLANNFFIKSGDDLVDFLFHSMQLEISYENNCNFLDAFIFKGEKFQDVYVGTEDFPDIIFSEAAHISFDYKYLLSKKGVMLNCLMYQPVLKIPNEKENKNFLSEFLPQELLDALIVDGRIAFDAIEFNVLLYDVFAQIIEFQLYSKDINLFLSGKLSNTGSADLFIKANFSKEIGPLLPEDFTGFLEDAADGGYKLELSVKKDTETGAFSIDSPFLKFSIGQ